MIGLLARLGLSRVPPRVWIAICLVLLLVLLVSWHGVQVSRALKQARAEGEVASNDAWQAKFDAMRVQAKTWREKAELAQTTLSQEVKSRHEEDIRRITVDANTLRLRGPGKATACGGSVGSTSVPASASGPVQAGGQPNDAGPALPADERAAVPWGWLVERAEQCDINRSESLAWREWYDKQSKLSADRRASLVH